MKLQALRIQGFKNLEDVEVDFADAGTSVVLVGPNGSGKSNLIEAIAIIFRDLAREKKTPFAYEVVYSVKSTDVRVEHDPDRRSATRFFERQIGEEEFQSIGRTEFYKGQSLLPHNVFGYYSGTRTNLADLFSEHEDAFYRFARGLKISKNEAQRLKSRTQLRSFFYGRLSNAALVLLAYFAGQRPGLNDFLKSYLDIDGFDCALLTLARPDWFEHTTIADNKTRLPWDTVASLDNELGQFLHTMWESALAPMSTQVAEWNARTRRSRKAEKLYLFFPDKNALAGSTSLYVDLQGSFAKLEALSVLEILEDVHVWVTRKGVKEEISSKEISDGEKQILTIVGLLYLTPGEESLFLLDEPDTHLNPSWKWEFLRTIEKEAGDISSCQFILTSHDPMTVAGLKQRDVLVVYKDRQTGKTEIDHPPVDPRGLGVAGVLRQVFGMPTTLDPETQALINERNRLLAEQDRDRESERKLHELNQQLKLLGISLQNQQDQFERFLKALNVEELRQDTLTPDEIIEQNEAVIAAIRSMKSETPIQ